MKKSRRTITVLFSLMLLASCANQFKAEAKSSINPIPNAADLAEPYWPFDEILKESDPYVSDLMTR